MVRVVLGVGLTGEDPAAGLAGVVRVVPGVGPTGAAPRAVAVDPDEAGAVSPAFPASATAAAVAVGAMAVAATAAVTRQFAD